MWDPGTYLRYADERSRPFHELVGRIRVDSPTEVIDLGCGPGTLTATLPQRWPAARVVGLDSSTEMIESAQALDTSVRFAVEDVSGWHPGPDVDVVLANAVLQWVPGHPDLLRQWAQELKPGSILAFQVPGNFSSPSHQSIADVAAHPHLRDQLIPLLRVDAVREPTEYATILLDAGCTVDAWETTYVHLLPASGPKHPVLAWMEGTALRPVRMMLDDASWTTFQEELTLRLREHYPVHSGVVPFPFRRIFVVART